MTDYVDIYVVYGYDCVGSDIRKIYIEQSYEEYTPEQKDDLEKVYGYVDIVKEREYTV